MNTESNISNENLLKKDVRLKSLDFYRGLIMVILMLGETDIFSKIYEAFPNKITNFLFTQFNHTKWRGLHFWDLILPAFMMISGTSMAYSYRKQKELNYSWSKSFKKILKRSFWLLFWGVLIYAVKDNHINLQFSNVLVELAVATVITFLIIHLKPYFQFIFGIFILVLTEILFRYTHINGFDEPFTNLHNFGNYIDVLIIGRVNDNYGSTYNVLPASVSTIWGLMIGQLLISNINNNLKIKRLLLAGTFFLLIGYYLDYTNIVPILKWTSSTSFIFVTGGYSIITFTFCFWWIDVTNHQKKLQLFSIVGMNSIFIYLFFNLIGSNWLYGYAEVFISGILSLLNIPIKIGEIFGLLSVFIFEWFLCYFLYKKRLFFKL